MSKEELEQENRRLQSQTEVFKQLVQDSFKTLLNGLGVDDNPEEEAKDERIKNLRGMLDGYHHKVKCQEKEIQELKDEITAQKAAFQVLLKRT